MTSPMMGTDLSHSKTIDPWEIIAQKTIDPCETICETICETVKQYVQNM